MSDQTIPTDPHPDDKPDVPDELLRPMEDRIADAASAKAARMAAMKRGSK